MVSSSVAEAVGGRLGVVEEVEKRWKQYIPNFFMRVKVALPLSKPLRRGAFLVGTNGGRSLGLRLNMSDLLCFTITAACLGMTFDIVLNILVQLRMVRRQNVNVGTG